LFCVYVTHYILQYISTKQRWYYFELVLMQASETDSGISVV